MQVAIGIEGIMYSSSPTSLFLLLYITMIKKCYFLFLFFVSFLPSNKEKEKADVMMAPDVGLQQHIPRPDLIFVFFLHFRVADGRIGKNYFLIGILYILTGFSAVERIRCDLSWLLPFHQTHIFFYQISNHESSSVTLQAILFFKKENMKNSETLARVHPFFFCFFCFFQIKISEYLDKIVEILLNKNFIWLCFIR